MLEMVIVYGLVLNGYEATAVGVVWGIIGMSWVLQLRMTFSGRKFGKLPHKTVCYALINLMISLYMKVAFMWMLWPTAGTALIVGYLATNLMTGFLLVVSAETEIRKEDSNA